MECSNILAEGFVTTWVWWRVEKLHWGGIQRAWERGRWSTRRLGGHFRVGWVTWR